MTNVVDDPKLLKYFSKRHLEKSSEAVYIEALRNYYLSSGLTPTEAINEADIDEDNISRISKRRVVDHLDDFEEYLEEKYKEGTLKIYLSIVKSFYRFNRITLPDDIRRPPNPTPEMEATDIPGSDDIKKALSYANPKYQAMIMLMASSGMRQGDIRQLTLQHLVYSLSRYVKIDVTDLADIGKLNEILPKIIGPLTWRKWMQKKKRWYTTFSTPESLHYILMYLDFKPPREFTPETPIFRNPHDKTMSRITVNSYFNKINVQCGWETEEGQQNFFRPHTLRKWFATELNKTEVGYTDTRHLLGHRIRDTTGKKYILPDYESIYNKYYKSMSVVTINGNIEVHDVTDERVKELKKEAETKDKKIAAMEKRMQIIENLLEDKKFNKELAGTD